MAKYDITVEAPAILDLDSIFDYIANVLKEPGTASEICDSIEKAILSLDQNPLRHGVVPFEPYASQGVRMLPVENYVAFYVVNEQQKDVHVIRVQYKQRNWQNVLYQRT